MVFLEGIFLLLIKNALSTQVFLHIPTKGGSTLLVDDVAIRSPESSVASRSYSIRASSSNAVYEYPSLDDHGQISAPSLPKSLPTSDPLEHHDYFKEDEEDDWEAHVVPSRKELMRYMPHYDHLPFGPRWMSAEGRTAVSGVAGKKVTNRMGGEQKESTEFDSTKENVLENVEVVAEKVRMEFRIPKQTGSDDNFVAKISNAIRDGLLLNFSGTESSRRKKREVSSEPADDIEEDKTLVTDFLAEDKTDAESTNKQLNPEPPSTEGMHVIAFKIDEIEDLPRRIAELQARRFENFEGGFHLARGTTLQTDTGKATSDFSLMIPFEKTEEILFNFVNISALCRDNQVSLLELLGTISGPYMNQEEISLIQSAEANNNETASKDESSESSTPESAEETKLPTDGQYETVYYGEIVAVVRGKKEKPQKDLRYGYDPEFSNGVYWNTEHNFPHPDDIGPIRTEPPREGQVVPWHPNDMKSMGKLQKKFQMHSEEWGRNHEMNSGKAETNTIAWPIPVLLKKMRSNGKDARWANAQTGPVDFTTRKFKGEGLRLPVRPLAVAFIPLRKSAERRDVRRPLFPTKRRLNQQFENPYIRSSLDTAEVEFHMSEILPAERSI